MKNPTCLKPHHAGISVANMEESIAWYQKHLDFELVWCKDFPPFTYLILTTYLTSSLGRCICQKVQKKYQNQLDANKIISLTLHNYFDLNLYFNILF